MALGVTGINPAKLGEFQPKLCQMTTTGEVGKSHYIAPHLESNRFVAALCCFSFPKCCTLVAEKQGFQSTAIVKNEVKHEQDAATAKVDATVESQSEATIELKPAANAAATDEAAAKVEQKQDVKSDRIGEVQTGQRKAA